MLAVPVLLHYRIVLIFRVKSNTDLGSGNVIVSSQFLLRRQLVGGLEIDTVERVNKNDEFAAFAIDLGIKDRAVRDPPRF